MYLRTNIAFAEALVDAWLAYDVSWALAIGMLAVAEAESNLDLAYNQGDSFGLYCWTYKRSLMIKAGCGVDVRTSQHIGEHVEAAMWELKHQRSLGLPEMSMCWTASSVVHWASTLFLSRGRSDLVREQRARLWALHFAVLCWSPRALLVAF